jgi:hypothetical protein
MDNIIYLIKFVGTISTMYLLAVLFGITAGMGHAISNSKTDAGTGEFLQFAFQNYWTLIVSTIFALLFAAYIYKHNKNEKRRQQEIKYSGSLIGKPL